VGQGVVEGIVDWVEESGEDLLESGFGEMIVQGMHLDGILWITIQSFPPVIRSSNNTLPDNSDVLIESPKVGFDSNTTLTNEIENVDNCTIVLAGGTRKASTAANLALSQATRDYLPSD
jgi:hypothetical protein